MSDSEMVDPVIKRVAAELRQPVEVGPAATARVMAAVHEAARVQPRRRSLAGWLVRPRPVMISPLTGLAAAAGLALVIGLSARHSWFGEPGTPIATAPAAAPAPEQGGTAHVQFVFVAPGASTVSLVGSFNDWDGTATPLRPTAASGVWSVTVPLEHGRHVYAFVVDGSQWVADPAAPQAPDDDFGAPNSVIMIGESST